MQIQSASNIVLLVLSVSFIASCAKLKDTWSYDRHNKITKEDYKDYMSPPRATFKKEADFFKKEEIRSHTIDRKPLPPNNISMENQFLRDHNSLYSVVFNKTQPIDQILYALANKADVNLKLDPNIEGYIIYKAVDRPFMSIIKDISDMAGLRYTYDNNILSIQVDHPYAKTYEVDYINLIRATTSNISVDVSVVSGDEAQVGSKSDIGTISSNDFWLELETHIRNMLISTNDFRTSSTIKNRDRINDVVLNDGDDYAPDLSYAEPDQITNIVTSETPADVFISKNSGLVTVFAKEKQHEMVSDYLNKLHKISASQVLIEAKILEVELYDEYAAGIDWQNLQGQGIDIGNLGSFNVDLPRETISSLGVANPSGVIATLQSSNNVQLAIDALSRFGTTKALSSPRITVMNNQSAILNVVENRVFFDLDVNVVPGIDGGRDTITVESNINSVPEGVLIKVIPSVNYKTNDITLMLRPTITRVVGSIEDPGVAIALLSADPENSSVLGDVRNLIPQLAVQEMDTIVEVQSGDIAVMGGLMQDRNEIQENGIPLLQDIPVMGNIFKSHTDQLRKSELVVFIKATVINRDSVGDRDREFYKTFSSDRNPSNM